MGLNAPQPPVFSVLLATRNRAEILRSALKALLQQETNGALTYEVIVIDNGSQDETRAVVEAAASGASVPVRYFHEPRLGRSWALNAGLAHASGRF